MVWGLQSSFPTSSKHCILVGADTVPSLPFTFARVLRMPTAIPSFVSDQSAMVASTRGCDRRCGKDLSSRGAHGTRKCDHCGRMNHTCDKCWDKFGKSDWLKMSLLINLLATRLHLPQLPSFIHNFFGLRLANTTIASHATLSVISAHLTSKDSS